MVECDDCGESVPRAWRRREYSESMTHRELVWLCESCHPEVQERVGRDAGGDSAVAMTDGGRQGHGCPRCGGSTINGQGLFSCNECSWSGPL